MLFNYHYVSHDIEKFQMWLGHLVKEVWCRNAGPYSLDLLHPELGAVVEEIANDDRITTDYLDGPIKTLDELFQTKLSAAQRAQVICWYDHNNDIESLCANDPTKTPVTYAQIKAMSAQLESHLKAFCKSLFTDVIHLTAVTRRIGSIDAHYTEFTTKNDAGKCPYCGYGMIKGPHHSVREAYDHFLSKGKYPFNSVNFRNLAPMCNECNSSYKLQLDPIHHIDPMTRRNTGTRRKAFYSYASEAAGIHIEMTLATADIDSLTPSDITLTITAPGRDEEVQSWKDVFGIEERYKLMCHGTVGKVWLNQIVDECNNHEQSKDALLAQVFRFAQQYPYHEANFLRKSFLIACQKAKLI
jgi:hypothetical protein